MTANARRTWGFLAAAALGFASISAMAQDRPGSAPDRSQEQDADRSQTGQSRIGQDGMLGSEGSQLPPEQMSAMMEKAQHSLADSIRIAERQIPGARTFRAECRFLRDSAQAQIGQQKDRATGAQDDRLQGQPEVVCVVSMVTTDRQITEVAIDTATGRVIGQRGAMAGRTGSDGEEELDSADRLARTRTGLSDRQPGLTDPQTGVGERRQTGITDRDQTGITNRDQTGRDTTRDIAGRSQQDTRGSDTARTGETQTGQPPAGQGQPDTNRSMAGASVTGKEFRAPQRWQKASDLIGKDVTNTADEDLGDLKDIVVDADSGRILYGVVDFGGFLGIGNKLFAVPWGAINLSADYKELVINVNKERLKQAEGFNEDQWPEFANEQWAGRTHEFYGQEPYWKSGSAAAGATGSQGEYHRLWNQPVKQWQKASDLMGKGFVNRQSEPLGELEDLVVDPDGQRLLYGIVDAKGKNHAVPWQALDLTDNAEHVMLASGTQSLEESAAFVDDDWPDFTDESWAMRTYRSYSVTPFWITDEGERTERNP